MTIKALSLSLKHTFSKPSSSTTNAAHRPRANSKKQQRPPLATTPGNNETDQDITFSKKGGVTSIRTATPIPNKPRSSNGTGSPSAAPANTKTTSTNSKHTNNDLLVNGIGPYQFLHTLGNGKFSRVILAKHRETSLLVAIKIIDKQAHDYRVMSRLVREIHLMELLEHPNIVKLYETFETCDSLFLVMEYVAGQNLDEYLQQRGGVLSESEARHLFRQLIQAIHTCHRHWIVHRDLKTPNILISKDQKRKVMGDDGKEIEVPVLKLADFGLGNRFGLQRLRTICGSMLYYSPEIISNQKYYGPEVDCWCLGIALFRMTAGFEPFAHAHTVGELKRDVCSCNFPMPASLSPALQTTILKCLQVDRRRRITVRHALYNDPWLTKNGQLPCPLESPTIYDDLMQTQQYHGEGGDLAAKDKERRTRRQLMKALEQEQPRVKRTLIFHPINASTYFTTVSLGSSSPGAAAPTKVASSGSLEVPTTVNESSSSGDPLSTTAVKSTATATTVHRYDQHVLDVDVEPYRSSLLQVILHKRDMLGLKSTEKWRKMFMVRPQQLLHLKSTLSSQSKPNVSLFSISSGSSSSMDQVSSQQKQEKATANGKLFSWTQMMQRIQDQVYYYHVDDASTVLVSTAATSSSGSSSSSLPTPISARHHPQTAANTTTTTSEQQQREELMSGTLVGQEPPLPSLTLSSITTSGSIDEPLDSTSSSYQNNSNNNPLNTTHHPQKHQQQQYIHSHGVSMHYLTTQLEKEGMELLKLICQLMGITYYQDETRRLVCVLTLRDTPLPLQQTDQQQSDQQQQPEQQAQRPLQRRSSKNSTASTQRSYTSTSTGRSRSSQSYEQLIIGGGGTYPTNASATRFQLPLISHLASSMTTSFFSRKQNPPTGGASDTAADAAAQQQESKKKEGVAVFTVSLEMLLAPSSSSSSSTSSSKRHHTSTHRHPQQHVMVLRFSKVQGSNAVFKMAGGWITGVLEWDEKKVASPES